MTKTPEPLDVVRVDVERKLRERAQNMLWTVNKWLGPQLLKLIVGGGVSVGLLLAFAPIAAMAVTAFVFVGMVGYIVGQRRLFVHIETRL